MRAIRQHAFGGPEQLRLEEVPDPRPADDQVRIRVESAGVHLLDTIVRQGGGGRGGAPSLPMTPGREVAGVVDEVGADVDTDLAGRRVVADLGLVGGGYAELALASAAAVHLLPDDVEADSAVAMVGTGRTTLAILALAAPAADDVVLVTAAAGGIGTLLVQACRAAGATVVGVAGGTDKVALARRIGADHAIDYSRPDWPDTVRDDLAGRPVTLALDGVGGQIGRSALELLGVTGRLVMFGSASGSLTELSAGDLFNQGISVASAIGVRILQRPGGTRPLERDALQALYDKRLIPVVGQRLALADAPDAHAALQSRATTGKTVLRP
ncbi:zinc-binding dehydrogenase [Spirillospora sp. CA-128828]|uniref:zinc-binding dehydrogenase n=1 Tax=Spirillospora sp. CA-128828 TaxID=3240033 RepID=UPI003D9095D7